MSNCIIGWPNRFIDGTISTSADAGELNASQLANDQGSPAQAWQAPATSAALKLVLSVEDLWVLASIHRTNLTAAAQVSWRIWAGTDQNAAPVYSSGFVPAGIVPGVGQSVKMFPLGTRGRTLQLDIRDPGNPDGFINIPQAFAGRAWQPQVNMDYGSAPGRTSKLTKTVTRSGALIARPDWIKRAFTLSLSAVKAAEVLPYLDSLDLWARQGNNVLFVPDPASPNLNQQAVFGDLDPGDDARFTYTNQAGDARGFKATISERL